MARIKVGIKFRPILKHESKLPEQWIVSENAIHSKNAKYSFAFENIFNENYDNEETFGSLVHPAIDKFLDGYNTTILSYGQTSSGKTYTMVGNQSVPGIIEMTIDEIFNRIDDSSRVSVGYLEIYNERVFDLLDENKRELKLLEYQNEVQTNQKVFTVNNKNEVMKYFHNGNKFKHMGESLINRNSSRSHTIFRITIESIDESGYVKAANMFLVDLAGSEKPDITKNSFGEGLYINKSLLSLGKIIRQLADKNVNVKHIRYRESILTRLLSSALGGNSFCSIICTASKVSLEETFNTICFARNAEKVKCKPSLSSKKENAEVTLLREQVKRLQKELTLAKSQIFNEDSFENSISYKSFVADILQTKKRPREDPNIECCNTPKIFVKTVEVEDMEKIRSMREILNSVKKESSKIKNQLDENTKKFDEILRENEKLKSEIGEEKRKTLKLQQKRKVMKSQSEKKKIQIESLKKELMEMKSVHSEEESYNLKVMYKNLTIYCLEKKLEGFVKNNQENLNNYNVKIQELCDNFAVKIHQKDEKIKFLKTQVNIIKNTLVQDNQNHMESQREMSEKINQLNMQIQESKVYTESLAEENEILRNSNEALKLNFKDILKTMRHERTIEKENLEANYKSQLKNYRNEELKSHLKLQEHYEKIYATLKKTNSELKHEVSNLKSDLNSKSEELYALQSQSFLDKSAINNSRKHEHDKIMFIKKKFESKLVLKEKYYMNLLKVKDDELEMIKNQFNGSERTSSTVMVC